MDTAADGGSPKAIVIPVAAAIPGIPIAILGLIETRLFFDGKRFFIFVIAMYSLTRIFLNMMSPLMNGPPKEISLGGQLMNNGY